MMKYDYNTYDMNATMDAIKDTVQESFPMTNIECIYIPQPRIIIMCIRYFCYDNDEVLTVGIDYDHSITTDDKFLDNLIYDIGDKIAQKEAEYATKRRSIRGDKTAF